jgi:curved DNA-binding protein CbpA
MGPVKSKFKRVVVESPVVRGYFEFFGVSSKANHEEIKKAYKRLALLYHPDRNPSSKEQFLKVTEAYETLIDPKKIEELNREHLDKKLYDYPLEGINISFGSFFGFRTAALDRVERDKRIGQEKSGESDSEIGVYDLRYAEDSHSILDSPAFDSIELFFAGKFSADDEKQFSKGFKGRELGQFPWILLNNQGIMNFLDAKFEDALKCYTELNDRVANNIIFLYREALCHSILAFKNKRLTLTGFKPDRVHFKKAVDLLRKAIRLGESRSVGKQKCLTIRKTLADILEKAGFYWQARRVWKEIRGINPNSTEATLKLVSIRIWPKLTGKKI